jgi:hypothetical protein
LRQQQRYNVSGPDTPFGGAIDPRNPGSDVDAMAAERGDAPARVTLQPEEANAKAKAAGAQVTFDKPIADTTVQSVIDDHLTQQQRADVISRNGSAILAGAVPRFVTSSLVSLADPLNLAAMMIPAAPEAFVAEKLAAAGGMFERAAIRGAAGAANGAVGMAALEPLNYAMSKSDYNDWSAGDALRNIFMGAALGAGGHMLLGGLFGKEHLNPNTSMEATRAAIAQVAEDRPVDVAGITDTAATTQMADTLEKRQPGQPFDAPPEGTTMAAETPILDRVVAALAPADRARYDDIQTQLADPAIPDAARAPLQQEAAAMLDQTAPAAVADLRAQAATAAKDMAQRAMNPPTDPVIDRAQRINQATVEAAPKFASDIDKDTAELTKLTQDLHQQLQAEIASGRVTETQEMRDMMEAADHHENVGKASANYAACLAGKGAV